MTHNAPRKNSPPKKRSSVLASLSRTLSPRRNPLSISSRSSSTATLAPTPAKVDYAKVGCYFTGLSGDELVRASPGWKGFFAPRRDDAQSARLERRIGHKRAMSDATTHLSIVPGRQSNEIHVREESGSGTDDADVTYLSAYFNPPASDDKGKDKIAIEMDVDRRDASAASSIPSTSTVEEVDFSSPSPDVPVAGNGLDHLEPPPMIPTKQSSRPSSTTKALKISISDFEILKVLGRGCAGKVMLVKQKATSQVYAIKAIHKTHVLAHRELDHTKTEQAVLRRCARDGTNPFVVKMHYSFHDKDILYLTLDFHAGGDLASQLQCWGQLGRDRARFYTAEIAEGIAGLHRAGIIYRDLKPENILIAADGHVVLTDFGLSKDFKHDEVVPRPASADGSASLGGKRGSLPAATPHWAKPGALLERSVSSPPSTQWQPVKEMTGTFCGTAEYLAPEVLLGEQYSYEVDSWSLGTMLYEMLAGQTPFWVENDHAAMYRRVLHDTLTFPDDERTFDPDTKSLLRGLLQKDPSFRMDDARIRKHPYFGMIEWQYVFEKRYMAPFVPEVGHPADTNNFDPLYLQMVPQVEDSGEEGPGQDREPPEGEPQAGFDEHGQDVFDGYSYDPRMEGEPEYAEDEDEVDTPSRSYQGSVVDKMQSSPETTFESSRSALAGLISSTSTAAASHDSPKMDHTAPASPAVLEPVAEDGPAKANGAGHSPMVIKEVDEVEEMDDDDWEHVVVGGEGEARNGGRGATLFARGVKDRYKMLVTNAGPKSTNGTPAKGLSRRGSRMIKASADSRRSSLNTPTAGSPTASLTPEPRGSGLVRQGSARSDLSEAHSRTRKAPRSSLASDGEESVGAAALRKSGTIKKAVIGAFSRKGSVKSSTS